MMQLAIEREQEGIQSVIDHHESIKRRGLAKRNDDGTETTFLSTIVSDSRLNEGRQTVIPLFWGGKKALKHKEAIKRAIASGKKWPSADTVGEAQMLDDFAHKQFK
jgi:hypothetical protein